jgi:hypothetical protein
MRRVYGCANYRFASKNCLFDIAGVPCSPAARAQVSTRMARLLGYESFAGTLQEAEALILDFRDGWGGAQAPSLSRA